LCVLRHWGRLRQSQLLGEDWVDRRHQEYSALNFINCV
jgi:hypothetical protein